MTVLAGAIAAVVVAVITATGSWLLARRTNSGTIDTTQAATLWEESRAMRAELRDQVARLHAEADNAQAAATRLEAEVGALRREVAQLRKELEAKSHELDALKRGQL